MASLVGGQREIDADSNGTEVAGGRDRGTAVLTVRIIRSFEHRNIRPVVFRDVDLDAETSTTFLRRVLVDLKTRPGLTPPVRNYDYDTLKVTYKAHGAKSNNLVIDVDDDERKLLLPIDDNDDDDDDDKDGRSLRRCGVEHETELSLFKMDDYLSYKRTLLPPPPCLDSSCISTNI